jgi:hypothetical protein
MTERKKPSWELRIVVRLETDTAIGEENAVEVESLRSLGLKKASRTAFWRALKNLAEQGVIMVKDAKVWLLPEWWKRLK